MHARHGWSDTLSSDAPYQETQLTKGHTLLTDPPYLRTDIIYGRTLSNDPPYQRTHLISGHTLSTDAPSQGAHLIKGEGPGHHQHSLSIRRGRDADLSPLADLLGDWRTDMGHDRDRHFAGPPSCQGGRGPRLVLVGGRRQHRIRWGGYAGPQLQLLQHPREAPFGGGV
jgi:hypothetical protein